MLIQNFSHQIILHFLTWNDIIHYELGWEEIEKVKNIFLKKKRGKEKEKKKKRRKIKKRLDMI